MRKSAGIPWPSLIARLEHYFEMSKVDATEALRLYRHFCKQTERVVEFLGVAKKLQNLLNVPIPNLKHVRLAFLLELLSNAQRQAPVSLVKSLEEYLKDPHFEQNRIEYKANKDAAERGAKNGGKSRGVTKKLDEPGASTLVSCVAAKLSFHHSPERNLSQCFSTEYLQ